MLFSLCELSNLLLIPLDSCVQIGHCCPNGGGSEERSGTGKVLWGARKRKHQGICEPPCQQLNNITSKYFDVAVRSMSVVQCTLIV